MKEILLLFFFSKDLFPEEQQGNRNPWVGNQNQNQGGYWGGNQNQNQNQRGYNWGRGHVLGGGQ